ncbi:hypothetical protein SteCoe_37684 [Stentor coeruleus]|uniref:Uncharacterized protein n=1 Tax=Stentor coeruleus TaxID=5963 RepID=A0A1R2AMJ2_9CILI|nr:hypothetical protein SteCoe_37684 [Stentor coeruleus]
MSDSTSKLGDLVSITSSLKIDEAIARSRKVMEESKALTLKNSQKKLALEEKFKSVLSGQNDLPSDVRKDSSTPKKSLDLQNVYSVDLGILKNEDLANEVKILNNKIASQNSTIKVLEMNLAECKNDNFHMIEELQQMKQRHRQEIQYLTDMYEEKLRNLVSGNKDVTTIETRLKELEEKFKRQVEYNYELVDKINDLSKNQDNLLSTRRLAEIEKEFEENRERCADLQDRIEKAHVMIKNESLGTRKFKKSKKNCETEGSTERKKKKSVKKDEEGGKKKKKKSA